MVLLFSSLWAAHLAGMGFDFIMIAPLLPSHCGFFFVFGCEISFFGGFLCLPVDGCSMAGCNFDVLIGGDEHTFFYSAIFFSSIQFSRSVSDSLRPHELQHTRPPCPSLTPGVHSNPCPFIGNAIQLSYPLSSPSSPALNISQH